MTNCKPLFWIAPSLVLTACSGGDTTPTTTPPPTPVPTYATISGSSTDTVLIQGAGIQSNGSTGALAVVENSGSIIPSSDAVVIGDSLYTLNDGDGRNATGSYTDGSGGSLSEGAALDTSSYDYLRDGSMSYQVGGTRYDVNGIYGVATNAADMPSTASASYTGEASGTVITTSAGFDLNNGQSTIIVDFGSGDVDVILSDFTAIDQTTGLAGTAPIDTITINDMSIDGNRFEDGTLILSNGGSTVDITGPNTATDASGIFAGYDTAISAPDEVGGVLLSTGDNGIVTGVFVGD